jgi:hypothetical protein
MRIVENLGMPLLELSPDNRAAGERKPSPLPELRRQPRDRVAGATAGEGRFMRRPNTADEVLAWLNACAVGVDFQDCVHELREKNRVIVQYRVSSGVAAVGGRDLRAAVL